MNLGDARDLRQLFVVLGLYFIVIGLIFGIHAVQSVPSVQSLTMLLIGGGREFFLGVVVVLSTICFRLKIAGLVSAIGSMILMLLIAVGLLFSFHFGFSTALRLLGCVPLAILGISISRRGG